MRLDYRPRSKYSVGGHSDCFSAHAHTSASCLSQLPLKCIYIHRRCAWYVGNGTMRAFGRWVLDETAFAGFTYNVTCNHTHITKIIIMTIPS